MMLGLAKWALLAACMLSGVSAGTPPWYDCDCSARNQCMCPSLEAPGGVDKPPLFILLTHDDAILPTTARAYRQVCDSRKNPDGCAFRATMFTQAVNTDCELAKKMWEDGYEIATHTANHIQMPEGFPHNRTVEEILGAKRFLVDSCGIQESTIRGFRSPYLVTNPTVRQVLFDNGFLFDSTLLELGQSESVSTSFANRIWPYTMDFGIAQNCAWFSDTQAGCGPEERWPGLWEIPMWVLQAFGLEWTMDVGFYGGRGVYEPLKAAFELAYNGNRAPLPIYLHTTWVDKQPSRVEELERFADFTAGFDDVYWVTMSQLIEWMKDPKPASQMAKGGTCRRPEPPPPQPPLPAKGANVTLALKGATRWQVADQADRLTAAVTKLLGPGRATGAFVAATAGGAAAQPASGDQRIQAQSLLVGSAPTGDALLDDGFMQFEGPSYGPAGAFAIQEGEATTATAGTETGASTGSDATLTVTVAAAGADPLALHKHADDATRQAALAEDLAAMGLTSAGGNIEVVPFAGGAVLPLTAPTPAAAAPAAQPQPKPVAAPAPAAAAPAAVAEPTAEAEAAPTASSQASSGSSSSGDSGGLSTGAIAGIAIGVSVLLASAVGAVMYHRRPRRAASESPSVASSAGSPKAGAGDGGTVSISVCTS